MTASPCTAAQLGTIALREPHRLAVDDEDGPVSYGRFHHRLLRCAQLLAAAGLRAGDRVAVGGPALGRQLLVLLAVEGLGAVTASFGAEGDDVATALFRHVQWVAAQVPRAIPEGVRFILLDDAFLASLDQSLEEPAPAWAEVAGDAPARLARTSGSTGAPKFLLHPRLGHDWWIDSLLRPGLVQGPASRLLVLCPLLVGGAFARASAGLRSGAAVLGGMHLDLDRLRPNLLLGLAVHLERFLDALPPGARFPAPVATVILGGAVPAPLRERITTVLGGRIENTYGSNEVGPVAAQAEGRGEGPLVPHAQVRILDDAGNDLPIGALGTIAMRTPLVGRGYLGDEAASAAYRDGWFVSADVGLLVRPGVLRVLGRRDDLLVIGGLKIAAAVLEGRLASVPSVAAAAALSVQLDGGSSTLGVALVLAPGCTLAQAQADLSQVLADVAGLGIRFLAVDALPRLPGGKLDRGALLRQLLAQAGWAGGRGSTAAQLGAVAARDPDRLAIHDDEGPVTYGQLDHRVRRCAQVLAALGLRAGDRVAIGGPGLARQVVVTVAVEGLGGVTASFALEGDASAAALFRHVQWVVAGQRPGDVPAGARFVAIDDAFLAALRQPLDAPALPWITLPDAAPVRLARTSGSTGASKFLLQSWRGHDWSIDEFARGSLVGGRDARMLLLSPLLVGGAYPRVSACLRAGAAVLAAEHIVLDVMRPTFVFGLPAHLDWFVHALPAGFVMPAPVAASVAGGTVPRPLRERLEATLGGPVNNSLGCNEAGPICFHLDAQGIGTLVPGVEVRILDEAGSPLPDGQPGILALRTPLVGAGYLEPTAGESGYRDGWFVTSDVCARVGSDRLQLFGRRDDLLVLGGLKVSAAAVEEKLLALPSLAAAAVQSVRLDGGRTTLGVAVVLADGHATGQAHAQVSAALADIAALGIRLIVLEQLPRLAGGKVDRPALLQRFLALRPS